MNYTKISLPKSILAVTAIVAALLVGALLMTGVLAVSEAINEITSITLNKNKTELTVEIALTKEYAKENKSASLYLFEFLPYQSTSGINSMEPVKELKVSEKISVKLPYISGNLNRLYSKFVVAEKAADGTYNIITKAKYVENIGILAENNEAYPTGGSKKGLQIQMFSDAQQLGVAHTVVNVALNEYMLGENSDAAQSFVYNAQTFYIDRAKLALLDHRVKTYTEAGINVYFNIILTAPDANAHPNILSFYCDDISADATLYALNTKNETAMKAFQAFVDYLSARYTRADHAYGFVPAMILGFEVNSNRVWNNAGQIDITNYIYSYCTAFRVAYTALTSHYSEGRVYISLGNNFCSAASDLSTSADSMWDYPAKDFLDLFAAVIKSSGDIPWGLSINPYASNSNLVDYWNDTLAEDNFETPFITMKNIGTLTRYMRRDELLYDSEPRSIIIGEFGISGDPSSDSSMTMQAAAYALAYYTAAQNEDIDAFIYHRHVDHSSEVQYFGLWTNKAGSVVEPSAKKPIYNVFSHIDTERSEEVTAFVKQTVGNGAFGLFMEENVKYKQFNTRMILDSIRAEASDFSKGYESVTLFDLTEGKLCNFYPSDSVEYVELRPFGDGTVTMLYAKITDTPTEYKGISNSSFEKNVFEDAHYITLRLMIAAPAESNTLNLMLRLQSDGNSEGDTVICEGETSVKPNEWQEVSFKIKDLAAVTDGSIDVMKLWVRTADSAPADGEYGIWLETVTLHTKNGMGVIGWIFTILMILVLLAAVAYGMLFLRAQYIKKKRREAAERRRREQLRAQQLQRERGMYPPPYSPRTTQNGQDNNKYGGL